MSEQPILVLVGRQRPHLVMLLVFSLSVGVAYLLGWPQPRSVRDNFGDPFQTLWSIGLVSSGLIGLLGAYWRGEIITGLLLERAGMMIGAGAVFGYAWTVSQAGTTSTFAAGFCVSWGIANLVRAAGISKDLRSLGRKKTKNAVRRRERSRVGYRGGDRRGPDRSDPGVGEPTQESS